MLETGTDENRVVEHIAVGQHDPFRRPGRAGSILQKGERFETVSRIGPFVFQPLFNPVSTEPGNIFEIRGLVDHLADPLKNIGGCHCQRRFTAVGHRLNPEHGAVPFRRIDRHGGRPGIETAEKRADKIEPRRIEQQNPLARLAVTLKPSSDSAALPVEFAVRQMDFFPDPVLQIDKGVVRRLKSGSKPNQISQVGIIECRGDHLRIVHVILSPRVFFYPNYQVFAILSILANRTLYILPAR